MNTMTDENFIPQIKPDQAKGENPTSNIDLNPKIGFKSKSSGIKIPRFLKRSGIKGTSQGMQTKGFKKSMGKKRKIIIFSLLGVFILMAVLFLNVYFKTKSLIKVTSELKVAIQSQNLSEVKENLGKVDKSINQLNSSYKLISWLKIVPFFGAYVNDGQHVINAGVEGVKVAGLLTEVVEPYADLLGFSQAQETSDKTAEDRIDFIVKTLPALTPKLDELSTQMVIVQKEVNQIDPSRYPVKLGGRNIRDNIERIIEFVDQAASFITDGKPLIEQAPFLLGIDSPRTYLVLFQNDKELRPTGGFLTAYSIMKVDKGKFEPVTSDDIYNLDARYKPRIPAPDPIVSYIKGPYILSKNLRLRDINWSPDFYEAMKVFTEEAETAGVDDIDGVIAVDTQMLVNLLEVIGTVGVPGFGKFSTEIISECNCPQVIYELESFADTEGPMVWDPNTGELVYTPPNFDNRKKIIGPLMNSVLSNAMGQPKEKLPELFEAGFKSLTEKHVLFYLFDANAQKSAEGFNIAGKVNDYNGDYLLVNDANLGGRKSNLYVTQEVSQEYEVKNDGSIEKTVAITYNNPEKHDGWLNSVLPNWVRIYVPKGSQLIAFEGVENKEDPYDELGKSVFAGYFQLRPQGVAKVAVKYRLPFNTKDLKKNGLKLLVQKQPGKDAPLYQIKFAKQEEELFLNIDKEFKFKI